MEFDHFVLGQGIAGTLLSWHLLQAGKTVLVIDKARPDSSSKVAAGIINPVTGKRYVAQNSEHLTLAYDTFEALSETLGCKLITPYDVIRFDDMYGRKLEDLESADLFSINYEVQDKWSEIFQYNSTPKKISAARIIDLHTLLSKWRSKLEAGGHLLDDEFSWDSFKVDADSVHYKEHSARTMICCEGSNIIHNPFFKDESYVLNKGQALILSIPGLAPENIYLNGIKLVPWHDGLFWAGTSFELEFEHTMPSMEFQNMMKHKLEGWLKVPYTIEDHIASVRVTTKEYAPIIKEHSRYPNIMLFNGLGSKGCLTGPFYAKTFAQKLA